MTSTGKGRGDDGVLSSFGHLGVGLAKVSSGLSTHRQQKGRMDLGSGLWAPGQSNPAPSSLEEWSGGISKEKDVKKCSETAHC